MGKTLVIAEKPSVARDLVGVLAENFNHVDTYYESDNYVVTSAIGHLVRLADPEEYDPALKKWSLESLPIIPESFLLKAEENTRAQLVSLHKLLQRPDIDLVINACDAGREGELIFAYIYDIARATKSVSRLWISSMTQEAIREGFANLRSGEQMKPLEAAARSRSEADWLVGMNATRAATIRARGIFDGVVSLGRVQTPTLAMIVKRDLEIEAFLSNGYFEVTALFEPPYSGLWFKDQIKRFEKEGEAQAVISKVEGKQGSVLEVETKEVQERPPLLYDLTALQREANSRFGFSADRTLKLAQSLYESRKAITYPRTSSRYLPTDMKGKLKQTAKTLSGIPEYADAVKFVLATTDVPSRIINDKKVTDHHALIPTLQTHNPSSFDPDEAKIFDLVARRFLAVFHPVARYEATRVITEVEGERFRTNGRVTLDIGWRALYSDEPDLDETKKDDDEPEVGELPVLTKGQQVLCQSATLASKETKPPRRYSESSLLAAMETAGKQVEDDELREAMKESGLGTPATRAATIERLLSVGYITRKGKQLLATDKGIQVIQMLGEHPLASPELTGSWEKRLGDIEQGILERDEFMADVRRFAGDTVYLIAAMNNEIIGGPLEENVGVCPRCGQTIKETAKAFSCSSYKSKDEPGCGFVIWKEIAKKRLTPDIARELLAHGRTSEPIQGFKSKTDQDFSAFLVLDSEGKVSFEFPEQPELAADAEGALAPCPRCGKGIVETPRAYSCSSYKSHDDPGCGFAIWKEMSSRSITLDEVMTLLRDGKTAVLEGFSSKSGNAFSAALSLKDGEVSFDFPALVEIAADSEGALGACPRCKKGVVETARAYSCSSYKSKEDPGCGFVIWKETAKRPIVVSEAQELLATGKTEVLHGFKSKAGSSFSAALRIEEDGKVGFEFPAGSVTADAEGSIGPCPICGKGVIEKTKSYSCSSWQSTEDPGCGFVIWKEMAKRKIGITMAKALLTDGRTASITGFKSKAGKSFDAALVVKEGRVEFEFDDQELSEDPLGECPLCEEPVKETPKAYSCSSRSGPDDPGCGFTIWKEIAGRAISPEIASELLAFKRTAAQLEGFMSKAGKPFSAHLVLDDEGKVVFDFEDTKPASTPGGLPSYD